MLKKILLGVLAVLVVFSVVVAMRPADFEVSRTATVNAPAEFAFAQVNDFKAWADWSPWDKLDAAIKRTYGDISAGQGATYHWVGNDQVGEGKMTITDAQAKETSVIIMNVQTGVDFDQRIFRMPESLTKKSD